MRFLILFILLSLSNIMFANDGVFYSEGGQLVPINETRIELRKEVLSLKLTEKGMLVNVYFEFYNPDGDRTETVGFVTPPCSDEFWEIDLDSIAAKKIRPFIRQFMVVVNDSILPFKIQRLKDCGFSFRDGQFRNEFDYVFHFQTHFKPGLNIIRHSYIFDGSYNMSTRSFNYRLTTGKLWANKEIADFQLILDIPGELMNVPKSFYEKGSPCQWLLTGVGRLAGDDYSQDGELFQKVFIRNGLLLYNEKHFKPEYDLEISLSNEIFLLFNSDSKITEDFDIWGNIAPVIMNSEQYRGEYITSLIDSELQLLINYFYARGGYSFKSSKQIELFKSFIWYIPDPNVTTTSLLLNDDQKKLLDELIAERNLRSSQKGKKN